MTDVLATVVGAVLLLLIGLTYQVFIAPPAFLDAKEKPRKSFVRFMELPPEIRDRIYQLLPARVYGYNACWDQEFESIRRYRPSYLLGTPAMIGDRVKPLVSAIAATCRTIRCEALASHFANTHFVFCIYEYAAPEWFTWLDAQDDLAISSIKTLSFE